jgi:hypothetical protein
MSCLKVLSQYLFREYEDVKIYESGDQVDRDQVISEMSKSGSNHTLH